MVVGRPQCDYLTLGNGDGANDGESIQAWIGCVVFAHHPAERTRRPIQDDDAPLWSIGRNLDAPDLVGVVGVAHIDCSCDEFSRHGRGEGSCEACAPKR